MIPVLVDSNVIIDVASSDRAWYEWSAAAIKWLADEAVLVINPIVYSELSVGYRSIEELDAAVPRDIYRREDLPWSAGFLAGRCFRTYRRRGGLRRSPLPDFYIGAHAAVAGYRLLTRDAQLYRSYFPTLDIIAPA